MVQLFAERAQEVLGSFGVTESNATLVAQLCRQLEGIPLALELAAAWLRVLPLESLLSRLEQRLALLNADVLAARPARQAGLRAALAWSYDLLPPAEQEALAQLSVFVGGWPLEAAEALMGRELLGSLRVLADSNLIGHEAGNRTELRFTMLATVREFAAEQLSDEVVAALRRRHALYYRDWAERIYDTFHGPQTQQRLAQLEAERDNLRAALSWMLEQGEFEWAAQLGSALVYLWQSDHLAEGQRWLTITLNAGAGTSHFWARAFKAAGFVGLSLSDFVLAQDCCERSLRIWRDQGEMSEVARTLRLLASVLMARGHYSQSAACYAESRELFQQLGDGFGIALVQLDQARLAHAQGQAAEAIIHYEEIRAAFQKISVVLVGHALSELGQVYIEQRAYSQAIPVLEECRDLLWDQKANRRNLVYILIRLGTAHSGQGNYEQAFHWYKKALEIWADCKEDTTLADCLEELSVCLGQIGNWWYAGYLLGFTTQLRSTAHIDLEAHRAAAQIQQITHLRTQLGAVDFDAAWLAGQHTSLATLLAEIPALHPPT